MMVKRHPIKEIIEQQKKGIAKGICSICSANEYVIKAAMERATALKMEVLIEATANQVNQYGGYTGMKPTDFRDFVHSIAEKVGCPHGRIILGGDHLGPLTWKNEPEAPAMEKSAELIRQYVLAGFTKIHIDTSMHLDNDRKDCKLETGVVAERGAILCKAAEEAYGELAKEKPHAVHPIYVIGSEVPIPGGTQEEKEGLQITRVKDFEETVEVFKKAYSRYQLEQAWQDVIAVVVQPGVEFGDETIHEYDREAAKELSSTLKKYSGLIFEGHSTDYQTDEKLKQMVEDGIAILKVGPALTFALREGLFALSMIEKELLGNKDGMKLSNFIRILDEEMLKNPENWNKHYHGDEEKLRLARKYSLYDRCRYYLPTPRVNESIGNMLQNLKSAEIPLTLLSQYMPMQYSKIRKGLLKNDAEELIKDRVVNCIDDYTYAVLPHSDTR